MSNVSSSTSWTLESHEVDFLDELKISALLRRFERLAAQNAQDLDYGRTHLQPNQKFWALSRILIEIEAIPSWGEEVVMTTWPKGLENIFALRDFTVARPDCTPMIKATSSWLMLDQESRKPEKIAQQYEHFPKDDHHALPIKLGKIKAQHDLFLDREIHIKYSDLDHNRHANHIRYVQWILDSFSQSRFEKHKIKRFQVNFLSEAFYSEKIGLYKSWDIKDRNAHYVTGVKANSDTVCFQSKVDWERK